MYWSTMLAFVTFICWFLFEPVLGHNFEIPGAYSFAISVTGSLYYETATEHTVNVP